MNPFLRLYRILCLSLCGLACALTLSGSLSAASVHLATFDDFSGAESLTIPDGNLSGIVDSRTISLGASGTPIESLKVGLNISGDFNGDLYGYLSFDSGMAVLLNRPGLTAANSDGYFDSGFNITLSEGASDGVQTYQSSVTPTAGSQLTGEWIPDGRNIHPESSGATFDGASRNAGLDAFNGLDADGQWTLFLADMVSGGEVKLESWSLEISLVPEPRVYGLACALLLVGVAARKRFAARTLDPHS